MTIDPSSSLTPAERRFQDTRQEYRDYLPLTGQVQADLREDVEQLQSQEGWDLPTQQGIAAWVEDRDTIFRFLKVSEPFKVRSYTDIPQRNSFDAEKTHSVLLAAMNNRVSHSLHKPVPAIPPYSESPLFYALPPDRFTDKLGRPIAVVTIREVVRDENGKLGDLAEWVWWTSELMRRALRDYWVKGKWRAGELETYGGEGGVAIIDAAGAGYRNIVR